MLNSGASVLLDPEDADLADTYGWHIFKLVPSRAPAASTKQVRNGREFRIFLHREVALRMRPDAVGRRFRVTPANGDYLDCRRENLHVALAKKKRGRPKIEPRPLGYKRRDYKGTCLREPAQPTSLAWAGGIELRDINEWRKGGPRRVRRCINGKPID